MRSRTLITLSLSFCWERPPWPKPRRPSSGAVTDSTGAVVPNTKVTAVHKATGLSAHVIDQPERQLRAAPAAGRRVHRHRGGRGIQEGNDHRNRTRGQRRNRVSTFVLEVGAITDAVSGERRSVRAADRERRGRASGGQPLHHADSSQRARFFAACCCLSPGTTTRPGGFEHTRWGRPPAASGSGIAIGGRDNQNNFTLDGASNNARQFGNIAMQAVDRLHPGVQGSHQFLLGGDGAGCLRPDQPDHQVRHQQPARLAVRILAQQCLRCAQHIPAEGQPPEPQPVRRGGGRPDRGAIRAFFFFNYEATAERRGVELFRSVPVQAWRDGDFSGVAGLTLRRIPNCRLPFPGNTHPEEPVHQDGDRGHRALAQAELRRPGRRRSATTCW